MKAKMALWAGIAGAAMVAACSHAHRGPADAARPARRPLPEPAAVDSVTPEIRVSPSAPVPDFWGDVEVLLEAKTGPGGSDLRKEVIERTADHLGWEASKKRALASVSESVVQEVESAWSVREARRISLPPELGPEIDGQYESHKRAALARIEALLEPSREPERLLLDRLEEWFDAIR